MTLFNDGSNFDDKLLAYGLPINKSALQIRAKALKARSFRGENQLTWLLKAITCIDLTTLSGDDSESNVYRLVRKAIYPLNSEITDSRLDLEELCCAAVCVYPARVVDAVNAIRRIKSNKAIRIASVATGFPAGQYPLTTRLDEIKYAINQGANEIDVVINRALALEGRWKELYEEIAHMRRVCGNYAHMKSILAVGELGSLDNVYRASMVSMLAGADFIKTSTGKEVTLNAELLGGITMARAIRDYHSLTGIKVGLKPAGGLKTCSDALNWMVLVKEELGDEWLNNKLFRFGATSLLQDIEAQLYQYVHNYKPSNSDIPQ